MSWTWQEEANAARNQKQVEHFEDDDDNDNDSDDVEDISDIDARFAELSCGAD